MLTTCIFTHIPCYCTFHVYVVINFVIVHVCGFSERICGCFFSVCDYNFRDPRAQDVYNCRDPRAQDVYNCRDPRAQDDTVTISLIRLISSHFPPVPSQDCFCHIFNLSQARTVFVTFSTRPKPGLFLFFCNQLVKGRGDCS
jgi:hypothetical protein